MAPLGEPPIDATKCYSRLQQNPKRKKTSSFRNRLICTLSMICFATFSPTLSFHHCFGNAFQIPQQRSFHISSSTSTTTSSLRHPLPQGRKVSTSNTLLFQQTPKRKKYPNHKHYHYSNHPETDKKDDDPHWYPISIFSKNPMDPSSSSSPEERSGNDNDANDTLPKQHQQYQNELEQLSIDFIAHQLQSRLYTDIRSDNSTTTVTANANGQSKPIQNKRASNLAKGHYLDLSSWNPNSEHLLEQLISNDIPSYLLNPTELKERYNFKITNTIHSFENIIKGGIIALQSLCIFGMQVGVKGSPYTQSKRVAHLRPTSDYISTNHEWKWTRNHIRQLKHDRNSKAAIQILAKLRKKQTAQGAMDLLVQLGIWNQHENLDFLRSGFPTRFTDEEEVAAKVASKSTHDPDQILNIRKDLRRQKVYTIDAASTSEIDDAISIEVLTDPTDTSSSNKNKNDDDNKNNDYNIRQRYWIHIADADQWAPRGSSIIECAKQRATSIYLPTGSYPMFPPTMSVKSMSLNSNLDSRALSLGVELHPDGSIDESSIVVTSSIIRVSYRLTYDEVDEMLEEGVGYSEEWQLGALLAAATKRRKYRSNNGSTEGMITNPLPQGTVSVQFSPENFAGSTITSTESKLGGKVDDDSDGEHDMEPIISINVESTHNAGVNVSATMSDSGDDPPPSSKYAAPVSPANLLVTEMMILAGEAMGKWGLIRAKVEEERKQQRQEINTANPDEESENPPKPLPNSIQLPFRSQPQPEFKSREMESNYLENLKENNVGNGYCAAWYARRFFNPVAVSIKPKRHFGMGLDCYVQWSSPIRRYGDLQVHAEVKRHLRREQINNLIQEGHSIPSKITVMDLGCKLPKELLIIENSESQEHGNIEIKENELPIDFDEGGALFRAGRPLQRNAQQYWLFEYIRRLVNRDPNEEVAFECMVLGCVDTNKDLYVVYVHELGLEHKYLSEIGPLLPGHSFWLKVLSINPRQGLLRLGIASNTSEQKRSIVARAA